MNIAENIALIEKNLAAHGTRLIVVSKTRSIEELKACYAAGQRDFGENRVQELMEKKDLLPSDIQWHLIGHLQRNKVKYLAPFVHLIHSVDSLRLLEEINAQGQKLGRVIDCLLQMHIAQEESKFGLDEQELRALLLNPALAQMQHIRIKGLMGMASFTENQTQITREFQGLKALFDEVRAAPEYQLPQTLWTELSMGMSSDYLLAAGMGSTMVRVGSAIFGPRIH